MTLEAKTESLEEWAAGLFTRCNNKETVALVLSYIPARVSAELYDTHGLSPVNQELWGRRQNPPLKVDLGGFEWEMAKRGADVAGLMQEIREIRRFYDPKVPALR